MKSLPGAASPPNESRIVPSSGKVTPPVLTVTFASPPASLIAAGSTVTAHAGVSSSVMVNVTSAGAVTPVPLTAADTRTSLSGASAALFSAVSVTTPLLSVASAAKLSVALSLSVKSAAVAGSTACADTVTANARTAAGATVAVTWLTPLSEIASGDSTSVTAGVPSSSMIVTVCRSPIGVPWWWAVITICSWSSSTWSSRALMVAVTSLARAARVTSWGSGRSSPCASATV